MKKIILPLLSLIFCSLFLASCASTNDPSENYRGETPQHIFMMGEQALRDRNYSEAIKRYEALDVQYPFCPSIEVAQLHLIYAYYMQGEYLSAEAAADRFIHTHPANPHVDYAYYIRGLANFYQNLGVFERIFSIDLASRDLVQAKKSYQDFAVIVRMYPNSCYAPAAHQQMLYMRNLIAQYEYQVACYYFSREAYMAAANRAAIVVMHYQGAPVVPQALDIMVRSYKALGLCRNADEAMRVMKYNYPNCHL